MTSSSTAARVAVAFARVDDDHALHPDEARALGPRATEKRRREHAAGRAAARRALARLREPAGGARLAASTPAILRRAAATPTTPAILRRDAGPYLGAPMFADPALAHLCVSISHHDGLAVAAVAVARVGVDLARREPLSPAFRETAFVDGEVAGWRAFAGSDDDAAACVAFAAKEAAAKVLGVGFALPLLGFRARPAGVDVLAAVDGCAAGFTPLRFRVRRLGPRVLVLARAAAAP